MNVTASRIISVVALLAILAAGAIPVQGAPAAAGQTTHVVQWGETLESIAARYGVTVSAIVQANGLANPNYIYVGQVLVIPTGGTAPSIPPSGTTYVVKWGDSLTAIAARFGISVDALMAANGLTNPNFIYAGQVLRIPGSGAPAPAPSPPSSQTYYTVRAGDTLTSIAYRFGTTVDAIMRANGLSNSWYIYVGQVLLIPSGTALPPRQPAATYYTVQPGDTLTRIAMKFGTTVWALMQANNLVNASLIFVGQVLVIPGHVHPPTPVEPPAVYPTPVPPPIVWPTPYPPPVTQPYAGYIKSSDCTDEDTWELRSVIRVSVQGLVDLPVTVSADGFEVTGRTGTKPEYGPYAVEFAPFNQGTFKITPQGLGTSMSVRVDGRCTVFVEFVPVGVY